MKIKIRFLIFKSEFFIINRLKFMWKNYGKVAIIIGAGRGLGREEALAMAKQGCKQIRQIWLKNYLVLKINVFFF